MTHPKREDAPDAPGAITMRRHVLQQQLVDFAEKLGIPVQWSHELENLVQDDEGISVTFANGVQERFSFVVGCDGLRSNTRRSLFGEQPADYTGLATVCCRTVRFLGVRLTSCVFVVGWSLTDPTTTSGQACRKTDLWRRHHVRFHACFSGHYDMVVRDARYF